MSGNKRQDQQKESVGREQYTAPAMKHIDNLKAITFECENWQCSVVVPSPPTP